MEEGTLSDGIPVSYLLIFGDVLYPQLRDKVKIIKEGVSDLGVYKRPLH